MGPTLRRLFKASRPHRRKLYGGTLAAVAGIALGTAMPLLTRAIIDRAIVRGDGRLLAQLIGAVVVVGLIRAVLHGFRRQLAGEVSILVEGDLRDALYEHVQALDIGYHERVSTGQVMSRASSDLQAIRNFGMFVPLAVGLILQFFVIVAIMIYLDWPLALLSMAVLPFMAVATYRFSRRFDPVVYGLQQKLADLASVVEETVTGIRVVKAFGREAHQVAKLEREAEGIFARSMEQIRLRAFIGPLFELLPRLGMVAGLYVGGRRAIAGDTTIGTIVAFTAYLTMLAWPLRAVGWIVASAQRAATASRRVFEVLDTPPGVGDRTGARPLTKGPAEIVYEGVSFAYPGGGPTLTAVDLEVPAKTSLALVGQTGCGKSTLMRLLPRFIEPQSGRVLVDGTDIAEVSLQSLRASIGMVFEDTFLFSDTIRANIAFGRPDAPSEDIVRAAVVAQAHDFIVDLPAGYDTIVGEHGYTLSGGQRQRIAIARAVLMDPPVLILDDATSAVDARVEAAIRRGLREAMVGRTTLIVARRASTAALADRVAYMEDGRIVATATHEELWARVPAYREALVSAISVDALRDEQAAT
ncbi:MAG TPA: ABC transporter ATP-binding protein [Actinomycetota bacterium]|nr:ABC transporter ATP-binding protein [Actinomycetota bacterium]